MQGYLHYLSCWEKRRGNETHCSFLVVVGPKPVAAARVVVDVAHSYQLCILVNHHCNRE
jgi:hypothetical protein